MALQTIYFTKRFDSGLLKGLSVNTKVTLDRSNAWIIKHYSKGHKGKDVITGDKWTVTDASFQNYAR